MRRREFITLLGGAAAAWPLAARAQPKPAIIGVLGSGSAGSSAFLIDALKQGMNENGLTEGRDYVLDVRWAQGDYTNFAALASELAGRKSTVIIVTTIAAARATQQVAPGTPLVMTGLIDPVGVGLIASLARPGNNTTGISNMIQDVSAKGLELIREVAPNAKNIAALFNPNNPGSRLILEDVRSEAAKVGMTIQPIEFKGPEAAWVHAAVESWGRGSTRLSRPGSSQRQPLIIAREELTQSGPWELMQSGPWGLTQLGPSELTQSGPLRSS